MSPERAEYLRSQVPDDPRPLPVGHLACEVCGVAVPVDVFAVVNEPKKAKRGPFTRCPRCRALRKQAEDFAKVHPVLNNRLGVPVALDRIEWTLWALAVLGQTTQASALPVMLTRLYGLGQQVGFRNPTVSAVPECSPYPWAHVRLSERAALRAAYGAALRDRLALSAGPVVIPCPTTACLMCGITLIARPAIEVSRRGSAGATQLASWRAITVARTALGGRPSPDYVIGHVCPDCARAIDEVGGVGWRARSRAVVAYLSRSSPEKGARLRSKIDSDFPPELPAWGASERAVGIRPWAHLAPLIARL